MLAGLALLLALPRDPVATYHASDAAPLNDPYRPVTRVARDSFTLRYYTTVGSETRVEVREGDVPRTAYKANVSRDPVRVVEGEPGTRSLHTVQIKGLKAGRRYFYRLHDRGTTPTAQEVAWGAGGGYGREFSVSTQAPAGRKTIVRLPMKVLLMPNVINVASANADPARPAPLPPKMTPAEIRKIQEEFHVASRFFWVNSGMRLWVDYEFFVDERWQRWGPEPANVDPFYKGWPASRSYSGRDFDPPGGGDFTILDTRDPLRVTKEPVVEERPYAGQVEMAWPRRWNPQAGKWEFYSSGGGTYGVDSFPQGISGRSQFLGGGDTAWLTAHETHHQLESLGAFSLSNREDERIVFNHYGPRHRTVRPDGSVDEGTWTTSGRHGEHWDGMAFWDRQLTDAQWLRIYLGYTMTVRDGDEDGVPDDEPRLPLDERRFGSDPRRARTDGAMGDLEKAMLSTWVPGPLQPSWIKPPYQGIVPNPRRADNDGDGEPDTVDPYPLYPYPPLIVPMRADIDGDPREWITVPVAGRFQKEGVDFTFQQSHDEGGFYGLYTIRGPWKRVSSVFDGEGRGVYSGAGVLGFEITNPTTPGAAPKVEVKPTFGGAPGLRIEARRLVGGGINIEFSLPNRGEGPWFWERGGREIGAVITVFDEANRAFSVWEPYRPFYARMIEAHGKAPMPRRQPSEIRAVEGVQVLKPGDARLKAESGWARGADGPFRHTGEESALAIEGLQAKEFDLLAVVEAKSDAILGAFTPTTKEMGAGEGYVGFVGGYGNRSTRLRLFGREVGDEPVVMTPGLHRIQLTRRRGEVWLLVDGKPVVFAIDPSPQAIVDRLAILGGYGGAQVVHEVRLRLGPVEDDD